MEIGELYQWISFPERYQEKREGDSVFARFHVYLGGREDIYSDKIHNLNKDDVVLILERHRNRCHELSVPTTDYKLLTANGVVGWIRLYDTSSHFWIKIS
jgi:hypothetical protein